MKKIILILLIAVTLNAQSLFEGKAGDVWHITGSTIGTLAIQKYTGWDYEKSAWSMVALGLFWECLDETLGEKYHHPLFDPAGGSGEDILYDIIGIAISYPLRYRNCDIKLSVNSLSVRFYL